MKIKNIICSNLKMLVDPYLGWVRSLSLVSSPVRLHFSLYLRDLKFNTQLFNELMTNNFDERHMTQQHYQYIRKGITKSISSILSLMDFSTRILYLTTISLLPCRSIHVYDTYSCRWIICNV